MEECSFDQLEMMIKKNPHDCTLDELSFPTNFPAVVWPPPPPPPAKKTISSSGQVLGSINTNAAYSSSSSQFISFKDLNETERFDYGTTNLIGYEQESHEIIKKAAKIGRNSGYYAREHVIAERKRREKLCQRFVALSALIPGLNKVKIC